MRPLRSYAAAALAVAVLAPLAGCGGDEPESDPSPSPSATSPSESSSPTVEPASGKELRSISFRLMIPEGWKTKPGSDHSLLTTRYGFQETEDGRLVVFFYTADGSSLLDETLPELARKKARSGEFQRKPEILDNIEVSGVEMYHVAGPIGHGENVIAAGAIHNDSLVELQIKSSMLSPEELQQTLDSILATWQWL